MATIATLTITPLGFYIGSDQTGRLDPTTSASSITKITGGRKPLGPSWDGKVAKYWAFLVERPDGTRHECAVWDYRGAKWSTSGPDDVFAYLFGTRYQPIHAHITTPEA